jgi:hypothetical protein
MIGKNIAVKTLNGEQCFRLYVETGSMYKTAKILASQGIVNPSTQKPFSHMAVRESAWLDWGFDHLLEARKLVEGAWKANGYLLTDEEWYKMVLQRVHYSMRATPKKLEEFLNRNSYLKPFIGR